MASVTLDPSEIDRNNAEGQKLRAEGDAARITAVAAAEQSQAEARKANAEAAAEELRTRKLTHDVDRADEARRDELAGHKYNHLYVFDTQVSDASVKQCIAQLVNWERTSPGKDLEIEIQINSPGGEIFAGFALIDHIAAMHTRGHTVNTTPLGMAASMGGVILQVGKKRTMGAHSFLLIHEASFRAGGSFANVQDEVELVEKMHDLILDLFASRSKMTRTQIKRRWSRKDWWITSAEALKHGFIDAIV